MASSNAGPITGGELFPCLQDGQRRILTRPQVAQLVAATGYYSEGTFGRLTTRTGEESFKAIQGGNLIEMSAVDFAAYLLGTQEPDFVPFRSRPDPIAGDERLIVRQGQMLTTVDVEQIKYVRGLGGSAAGVPVSAGPAPSGSTPVVTPDPPVTPSLYAYMTDNDGSRLRDDDGAYLVEMN